MIRWWWQCGDKGTKGGINQRSSGIGSMKWLSGNTRREPHSEEEKIVYKAFSSRFLKLAQGLIFIQFYHDLTCPNTPDLACSGSWDLQLYSVGRKSHICGQDLRHHWVSPRQHSACPSCTLWVPFRQDHSIALVQVRYADNYLVDHCSNKVALCF